MAVRDGPEWAWALRELRVRHSLSQEDIAEKLNVDRTTISRWEAGRNHPQPSQVRRICDTFAISPAQLGLVESDPMKRRDFARGLLGVGVLATLGGIDDTPLGRTDDAPLTPAERSVVTKTLGQAIESGWRQFHTADAEHVHSIARAQVHMVQQHHTDLDSQALGALYSASRRLVGATEHRRGHYQEALTAHGDAYSAAAQIGDRWNMAQCRAWQAYALHSLGRSSDSLSTVHVALRLIPETEDVPSTSLRGRLLTSAAMYAAHLRDAKQASSMLQASEALLDRLGAPAEEFDQAIWLEAAGVYALHLGQLDLAAARFRQSLDRTPAPRRSERVLRSIALTRALAYGRERDGALATAGTTIPELQALKSRELTDHYTRFLRDELLGLFPKDGTCAAFIAQAAWDLSR
jgi:transcriptional regulator with XRE-family HTH domain